MNFKATWFKCGVGKVFETTIVASKAREAVENTMGDVGQESKYLQFEFDRFTVKLKPTNASKNNVSHAECWSSAVMAQRKNTVGRYLAVVLQFRNDGATQRHLQSLMDQPRAEPSDGASMSKKFLEFDESRLNARTAWVFVKTRKVVER
jgi:hypothetical protein